MAKKQTEESLWNLSQHKLRGTKWISNKFETSRIFSTDVISSDLYSKKQVFCVVSKCHSLLFKGSENFGFLLT